MTKTFDTVIGILERPEALMAIVHNDIDKFFEELKKPTTYNGEDIEEY